MTQRIEPPGIHDPALREIARVLEPCGRLHIDDILFQKAVPRTNREV
jgi:hypothetical protein